MTAGFWEGPFTSVFTVFSCFSKCVFLPLCEKTSQNTYKKHLQGWFWLFFLLVCCSGASKMSAEATQNMLRGSLVSSFCRYFARSLREAAFWTRRPQNTLDLNTPRGSKFVLSPARRASFVKIMFFPLDSFPARLESPRSTHFGPLF